MRQQSQHQSQSKQSYLFYNWSIYSIMNAQIADILITKRNGTKEALDIGKMHTVVARACEGLSGVSPSEVELKSQIQFFNGMKSSEIQETLIKAAADLISEDSPNYQYVAGRLVNHHLRKEVYGSYTPPSLYDHVQYVVKEGFYTPELLEWYTKEDFDRFDAVIDHDKDEEFTYVAMEQWRGKYLVQNRANKKYYETPQFAYMLIGMTLFHSYEGQTRFKHVKEFYKYVSDHTISLPTPILSGVRTSQKQFSSCTLINCGDSIESINECTSSIVSYVSQKAGIGLNVGRIRAIGAPIRNGDAYHTGIVPFIKLFQAAVKSCNQGSIRGGAATLNFMIWHYEIEDLIVLKNNKGIEENRARHLDYTVQLSELFYKRYLNNEDITLFSPNDVPEMYEAFFADNEKFNELYERAEKNTRLRKKKINARELIHKIMMERKDTGRIYIMNVDNVNRQGSFDPSVAPVYQSNLCQEITLPNSPLSKNSGEIALCTLGALNFGKIDSPDDFEKPAAILVRALDALLDYQNYPVEAAQRHTMKYRPLGIGITNFAYWMAKNGIKYDGSKEALQKIHEYIEAFSYYITKASANLAKEFGACPGNENTKYSKGILPIDTYKKSLDELVEPVYNYNWDELREQLKETGIRNSTTMAVMPVESSSQLSNSTNGIEPPRSLISYKQSKDGVLPQVVPGIQRLKNKYDLLWNQKTPEGYLKTACVIQKFLDQAMSVNTSYNSNNYPNNTVKMSDLVRDLLMFYKYGGKNLYYSNTLDHSKEDDNSDVLVNKQKTETEQEQGCAGGFCSL